MTRPNVREHPKKKSKVGVRASSWTGRKVFKGAFLFLSALALVFCILLFLMRPHTPPIRDAEGKTPQDAVALLMTFQIGGLDQWVSVRGYDKTNPLLLFLHGGPGMPLMYLSHAFQRPLEEHFLCVQWDRRGAGKTFNSDVPEESLNIRQLLDDTYELVETLKFIYGKEKIFLAGHSFGSYLGMLAVKEHPEHFHAFFGISQVVDEDEALALQERFIRTRAQILKKPQALSDLRASGPGAHEKWLFKFRGALHDATSHFPFMKAGMTSPEYGLFDIPKVARGSSFSSRHMTYNVIDGSLIDNVRKVEVPVYFLMGWHDAITPIALVEKYIEVLDAPHTQIITFAKSAHFPFFEEPKSFAMALRVIRDDLLR